MVSAEHSSDDASDYLPSEGYSKLKLRHDSESEIHISDDDDGSAMLHEARGRAKGVLSHGVQMPQLVTSGNGLSILPSQNAVITNSMKRMNTANRQSDNKNYNAAESSGRSIGYGLDEINWSQMNASDNKNDMPWKAMPEQVCAELPKDKSMYAIESIAILI